MSSEPAVIVKKTGFLSSLVKSLAGIVIVIVICGTALGIYGLRIVDRHAEHFTEGVLGALPEWRHILPPQLVDALNDRRDIDYLDQLELAARPAGVDRLVVEVANNGPETVSFLTLRIVLEDEGSVPLRELTVTAATPFACDGDWRGPLLPGRTRRIPMVVGGGFHSLAASVEPTDLRVWAGPVTPLDERPALPASKSPAPTSQEQGEQSVAVEAS
jgi:hypothetical protein